MLFVVCCLLFNVDVWCCSLGAVCCSSLFVVCLRVVCCVSVGVVCCLLLNCVSCSLLVVRGLWLFVVCRSLCGVRSLLLVNGCVL